MKALVVFLIIVSLIACKNGQKKTAEQVPTQNPVEVEKIPTFTAEKRAGKYGLILGEKILSSFEYDSINTEDLHPIMLQGEKKFVFFESKVMGPYYEIKPIAKNLVKIVTCDRSKSGFIGSYDRIKMFNYPDVEQEKTHNNLFWVTDKDGKKGLISTLFAVGKERVVLPLDNYLYTDISIGEHAYAGRSNEYIKIEFYSKDAAGSVYAMGGGAFYDYKHSYEFKKVKIKDLFGPGSKILKVNKAKNAVVGSKKGYALINLSGEILVPTYSSYEEDGDSAYIFRSSAENLRVKLNGAKI